MEIAHCIGDDDGDSVGDDVMTLKVGAMMVIVVGLMMMVMMVLNIKMQRGRWPPSQSATGAFLSAS